MNESENHDPAGSRCRRWVYGRAGKLSFGLALSLVLLSSEASAAVGIKLGRVTGPSWSRIRAAIQVALADRAEVQVVRSGEAGRLSGRIRKTGNTLTAEVSVLDAGGVVRQRAAFSGDDGRALASAIKAELWNQLGSAILGLEQAAPIVDDLPAGEAPAAPQRAVRPRKAEPRARSVRRSKPQRTRPAPSRTQPTTAEAQVRRTQPRKGGRALGQESFRMSFGAGLYSRDFSFVDNIREPFLASYSLGAAPALRLGLEWYPGAHFGTGAIGWVGLDAEAELPFAVESDREGVSFPTAASAWRVGLRGRLPLGVFESFLGVGFAERRFHLEVSDEGRLILDLPEVRYQTLSLRLGGTIRIGERVDALFQGGWGFMLDAGAIGRENWFPRSSSHTASAGGGINVHIHNGIGAFARFDWQGAFFELNPEPEDPQIAGGAVDHFYLGSVGVSYSATPAR